MSEETEAAQAPWPLKWARDESFWKGIASNVISGVVVAFFVWLGGLALGYFNAPMHFGAVLVVLFYLFDFAIFGRIISAARRSGKAPMLRLGLIWMVLIALGITMFMISAIQRGFFV